METAPKLTAAVLVVLTVAVYVPALRGGFIWDDDAYLTENPTVSEPGGLTAIWLAADANPQYYPLTFTTFWLEHRLWGLAPFGYHLVNVLLHAAAAILLWRILHLLAVPGAAVAAAIFAVHPVAVESVAWVTERKNVLSGALYLAAALLWLRSVLGAPGATSRRLPALSALLFVGALLSKSVTASLPVSLAAVIAWKRGWREVLRHAPGLAAMALLGAAAGLHTALLEKRQVGAVGAEWTLGLVERCLLAGRAFWFYLGKLLIPSNLAFFYPRWEIDAGEVLQYAFPAGAVALGCAFAWLARRGSPGPLVAVAHFAVALAPALGFLDVFPMRFSWVADHFQYLAMIGPIALAVAAGHELLERPLPRALVAAAAVLGLAAATWSHAGSFRDLETLWARTVARNPGAWLPHFGLGEIREAQGRLDEAEWHYRRALAARPGWVNALNNLGLLRGSRGDWPEAVGLLEQAVAGDPGRALSHHNLGVAHGEAGDHVRAVAELRTALELHSARADEPWWSARYRQQFLDAPPGLTHGALALNLAAQGQPHEALEHYRRALDERPDLLHAWIGMGDMLRELGRPEEARAAYLSARRLAPGHPEVRARFAAIANP